MPLLESDIISKNATEMKTRISLFFFPFGLRRRSVTMDERVLSFEPCEEVTLSSLLTQFGYKVKIPIEKKKKIF